MIMKGHVATLIAVLCALACFHGAQAGLGFGPCPKTVQPMANYQLKAYAGRWYEISAFGTLFEAGGKCHQAIYTPNTEGGADVKNVMVEKSSGKVITVNGWAKQVEDDSNSGKLSVTLSVGGANRTVPLYVLGSDYENFSVAYSCSDFFLFHYDFGWVLSRKAELAENLQETVNDVITSNGLAISQFSPQLQDCGVVD